ncbi:MAG: phosphate ABC transporter permease subunit PstC [Cellulosilyticaceae bacterium]
MKRRISTIFSDTSIKYLAYISFILIIFVFFFLIKESIPFLMQYNIIDFLFGTEWRPLSSTPTFGVFYILLGTLSLSILSVFIAIPIGIGCSLCFSFCMPKTISRFFLSIIDMISGIPSVIFGFVGLILLVKTLETNPNISSGESIFTGSLLLSFMLLPYIVTTYVDTCEKIKHTYLSSSSNLGIDKWYFIWHLLLPATPFSIVQIALLSFGRAIGETMAVMMVIGNSPILPKLFGRAETIPSLIALEIGSAGYKSLHYYALYAAALVLVLLLLLIHKIANKLFEFK